VPENPKNILKIKFGIVLAVVLCSTAGWFETSRALGGNTLSWVYAFEWPFLGIYGIYMGRRLLAEERGSGPQKELQLEPESDERLEAWNRYLAERHLADQEKRAD
jgi:hypothetical protein